MVGFEEVEGVLGTGFAAIRKIIHFLLHLLIRPTTVLSIINLSNNVFFLFSFKILAIMFVHHITLIITEVFPFIGQQG